MNSREEKEQPSVCKEEQNPDEQRNTKEDTTSTRSVAESAKCNNLHCEQKDVAEEELEKEMEKKVESMEEAETRLQLLEGENNPTGVDSDDGNTKLTCCEEDSVEGGGNKKDENIREDDVSSGPAVNMTGRIDNPVLAMLTEEQPQIDAIIEEVARRRNLTVLNVKSILRHVLKDKRVLALAEKKAAEEEGSISDHKWKMDDIITFEPKLTRARVRQELESHGGISPEELASLTNMIKMKSPKKKNPNRHKPVDVREEESESSDEEYNPAPEEGGNEESEDEGEGNDEDEDDESSSDDEDESSASEGDEDLKEVKDEEEGDIMEVDDEEDHEGVSDDDVGVEMEEDSDEGNVADERKEEKLTFAVVDIEDDRYGNENEGQKVPSSSSAPSGNTPSGCIEIGAHTGHTTSMCTNDLKFTANSSSLVSVAASVSNVTHSVSSPSSDKQSQSISSLTPIYSTPGKLLSTSSPSAPAIVFVSSAVSVNVSSPSATPPANTFIMSPSSSLPAVANTVSSVSPVCSPPPPSKSSCNSLVPPPDRALIYETAALLASLSDPALSPMKGFTGMISGGNSPMKFGARPNSDKSNLVTSRSDSVVRRVADFSAVANSSVCTTTSEALERSSEASTVKRVADFSAVANSSVCTTTSEALERSSEASTVMSKTPGSVSFLPFSSAEGCANVAEFVPENESEMSGVLFSDEVEAMNPDISHPQILEESEIANRTRSKLPLNDTPISAIEAMFVPPDDDDPPTPSDLAESVTMEEDEEWQKWLTDLFDPNSPSCANDSLISSCGEDEGDTEYNFPIDQLDEEKEEFRNDRAVKISKKEVDELVNEYLYPSVSGVNGLLSTDGLDLTSAYLLQSLGLQNLLLQGGGVCSSSSQVRQPSLPMLSSRLFLEPDCGTPEVYLTSEQTVQLAVQIQQHYQLLMQTFLLSRFEPSLAHVAQLAAEAVKELRQFKLDAKNQTQVALWSVPCLEEGLKLISRLDPYKEEAVDPIPVTGHPSRLPDLVKDIMMNSHIFWMFPHFLPKMRFCSVSEKQPSNYTTEEDYLLVMGMDHYGSHNWKDIHENLFPIKTPKQLHLRVKNSIAKRSGDNVIKHFKKKNEVLIPYTKKENGEGKKKQVNGDDLPDWVMNYFKKKEEKRETKKESKKKDKQSEGIAGKPLELSTLNKLLKLSEGALSMLSQKSGTSGRAPSGNFITRKELPAAVPSGLALRPVSTGAPSAYEKTAPIPPKRPLEHATVSSSKRVRVVEGGAQLFPGQSEKSLDVAAAEALTTGSLSEANMDVLLHAAGLESSSSAAKYAYRYLGEVKACLLGEDGMNRYEKFLDVLVKGCKENMAPSMIYNEVRAILHPWPHLVQLFTEFLTPEDCLRANAMHEKCQVESVKSFISRLKDKFKDSPVKINQILNMLLSLDVPGVTNEQIYSKMAPLFMAHKELVMELKNFLYHLAPAPDKNSTFEEVTLEAGKTQSDQFENVTLGTTSAGINTTTAGVFGSPSEPRHTQLFAQPQSHPVSPLTLSRSSASSKSPSSSKSSRKSSKVQASGSTGSSAHLSGIVRLPQGQQTAPYNRRSQTPNESSLKTTLRKSPCLVPAKHSDSEASNISKRKIPPRKYGNQRKSPLESLSGKEQHPVQPDASQSGSQSISRSASCSGTSESNFDDFTCESVRGHITLRLGGSENSTSLHTQSSGASLSESYLRTPLSSSSPSCHPCSNLHNLNQMQTLPAVTTSPPISSVSLTPLSTPTHSTPKSLVPNNSFLTKPDSSTARTRRRTNTSPTRATTPTRRNNGWTREEDRVILKTCLHASLRLPVDSKCFGEIAFQLQRDTEEIKARYKELFELYQSRKSKCHLSFPT